MKKILANVGGVSKEYFRGTEIIYLDFAHFESFFEMLSICGAFNFLTVTSQFCPVVFLGVPYIFLRWRKLRETVSSNVRLSRFLEPLLTSWLFTSIAFLILFCIPKVLELFSINQSFLCFFLLYSFIAPVIYKKKGLNPIFFDAKEKSKIHD